MAYASLAELRDWVGIAAGDTADDAKLTLALDAASELVDAYTGRTFAVAAPVTTRLYTATDRTAVDLDMGVASTTGLIVETDDNGDGTYESTWTLNTDYRLEPLNAAADGEPWTRLAAIGANRFPTGTAAVRVTASEGWPTAVPAPVKQATLIQAAHIWKRKDATFGVAGSPEFGNELRVESELDRTARVLLTRYRDVWAVV